MRMPLPFPECPSCHSSAKQCVHSDCNGKLEIDPSTESVYCQNTYCSNRKWNIWSTTYKCSCGHEFTAKEIKYALNDMLEACRSLVSELERRDFDRERRKGLGKSSFKEFLFSFMRSLGSLAGLAVETAIRFFLPL